ncbi:hypothetical protein DPMN_157903 [Dreissena polymorpha]|uniref:Uncharacterized protein n=1 Tax=Dreissena polymorpha TaxID=45954 RepID=A0A9D4IQF5_DREPO|nr:hypothetical protein DPMN_157903 [Dreissena polymorpha]
MLHSDPVSVRSSAERQLDVRKNVSSADRSLFVTEVESDGSDVSSLPDAWRSNTLAGDRIICDRGLNIANN